MLFFDVSSPLIPSFRGRKHWLQVLDDSTHYVWKYFLKEKFDLKNVIMSLIKKLKTKYNIQVQYLHCDNMGKIVDFDRFFKQEGMGM